MDSMSKVFDYTVQIEFESPKICDQTMALGSNQVNFFHHKTIDHGMETLYVPPLSELSDRYEFMHHYRKNNAQAQGKCNATLSSHKMRTVLEFFMLWTLKT